MIFHDVKQNTDEWLALRAGVLTGSAMATVMAKYGQAFGDPAKKLARRFAIERLTGEPAESGNYSNASMQRGHEFEALARDAYEREMMVTVTNGGFFTNDAGTVGDSPDGLVGSEGVFEAKCPLVDAHFACIERGAPDPAYKWQIQNHLWTPDRKWCDYVQFNPDFPEGKKLIIHRVYRDEAMIQQMLYRTTEFEKLVQDNIKILQS